jgi:DNA integrity scanning protein DisA with diadenylate cyclase activity
MARTTKKSSPALAEYEAVKTNGRKKGDSKERVRKGAATGTATKVRRVMKSEKLPVREDPTRSLVAAALRMAKQLEIDAVFIYAQSVSTAPTLLQSLQGGPSLILVAKNDDEEDVCKNYSKNIIRVPDIDLSRMDQVKLAVVMALTERMLGVGDRILCLVGRVNRHTTDTLVVLDVGDEFETMHLPEQLSRSKKVDSKVFEATLTMALELANEGREGRPIGSIFVVGDAEEVLRYSRQIIINPFEGHPVTRRNILDPHLRETVKEFSSLDGAFLIRKDGVLLAAGRHLNAAYNGDGLPPGLGSRHAAAAAITSVTKALALTISESTGAVTVFRGGKVMMTLERFRQAPSLTEGENNLEP